MKTLLSLDISSSTVGWAIFKFDQQTAELFKYGHFKPPSKKQSKDCLPIRLNKAVEFLENLIDIFQPDLVVIEDYAKSFTKGRSTANTIILLSVFNETLRRTAYNKTGKDPLKYPVATIRSVIGKHFNEKVVSKEEIFPVIVKHCQRFITRKKKTGNIVDQCWDEADAIACGIVGVIKQSSGTLVWTL